MGFFKIKSMMEKEFYVQRSLVVMRVGQIFLFGLIMMKSGG